MKEIKEWQESQTNLKFANVWRRLRSLTLYQGLDYPSGNLIGYHLTIKLGYFQAVFFFSSFEQPAFCKSFKINEGASNLHENDF